MDFAVNQQAEQIIFEVEPDGHIVAHVLIRYAGDPEQFAWIVPVPSLPELELSYAEAFAVIDRQTAPQVTVARQSLCPQSLYRCRQHPMPSCGTRSPSFGSDLPAGSAPSSGAAGSGGFAADAPQQPEVTVYARQQVGSYETIVFGAGDAEAAVEWLQGEGFIVNDTMTPFMQPYLDAQMLFVAAKLVPGADADEIRPLRLRYEGTQPMIPIQLTAVAAEPHLTITAYLYGSAPLLPLDQPMFTADDVPDDAIGFSPGSRRSNYPMVLSRLIDEEGGHAYMLEYAGAPPQYFPQDPGGCCNAVDVCGIGGDGLCQCPLSPVDAQDCASQSDLLSGLTLVGELATKHRTMTRLTTRLSPEEMSFDPMFDVNAQIDVPAGRLTLAGTHHEFASCAGNLIDREPYEASSALEDCAAVYCGRGECVATEAGAGCACNPGHVARSFTDLDGTPSVTCVPERTQVDLAAGGLDIPDVCGAVTALEDGDCVALSGFPASRCAAGHAAVLTASGSAPVCSRVSHRSFGSGARNYTTDYPALRICAPPPPGCNLRYGWLEPTNVEQRPSVEACASSQAHPSWLEMPPEPTCEDLTSTMQSGSGVFNPGIPASAAALDPVQPDTTRPRGMRSRTGDGCSVGSAGGQYRRGPSQAGWAGGLLAALAFFGFVAHRRARRLQARARA